MKSIIKHITGNGSYESKNGTIYKFEITMEDGYTGEIGHSKYKTVEELPYKVGEEKEYKQDDYKGYPKIKWIEAGNFGGGFKGKQDPKTQEYIIRQSSLQRAIEFFHLQGFNDKSENFPYVQVMALAEVFTEFVLTGDTKAKKNEIH